MHENWRVCRDPKQLEISVKADTAHAKNVGAGQARVHLAQVALLEIL
jgi:hypothetical protein